MNSKSKTNTTSNKKVPAWIQPAKKGSGMGGTYKTGEGQYRTVTINGNPVRMGPNTTITPNTKPAWWDFYKKLKKNQPGGIAGVRG